MREEAHLRSLSDDELLRRLSEILRQCRRDEASLIAHIAEVDARRAYAREAAPSMHAYCTDVLHLSDPETWLRIRVARASRKHPVLLNMLRDGRIHLSGIALLAPHLTSENRRALLKRATHRSKRQIEEMVAELAPRPDAPSTMRRLPAPRATTGVAVAIQPPPCTAPSRDALVRPDAVGSMPPGRRSDRGAGCETPLRSEIIVTAGLAPRPDAVGAMVEPLAPARYRVQFTASAELHDKLERLRALMRTTVPGGDLAELIDLAVTEKLERLEAKRLGKTSRPRKTLAETETTPASRHVPAAVRRAVHTRDKGQCTYVDKGGRRCKARDRLEFHHHGTAFARGGDHSLGNVRLMCRTHNTLLAEEEFGKKKMALYRRQVPSAGRVSEPASVYRVDRQDSREAGASGSP